MSDRPFKVTVPAALLVLGIALSCSTACITSAVIQSGVASHQREEARASAAVLLQQNLINRAGGQPIPPVTADPASLAQALRRALPVRSFEDHGRDPDTVDVQASPGSGERPIYTIIARGDFTTFYAEAFARYVGELQKQLQPPPAISLEVDRTAYGRSQPVLHQQFN